MIRKFVKNYLPRHRNRVNQVLHLIGVPLSFAVAPGILIVGGQWSWATACFAGGYLLQFAGHAVEGNDAGEIVCIKKTLGMPYTEYGTCAQNSSGADQHDDRTAGGNGLAGHS